MRSRILRQLTPHLDAHLSVALDEDASAAAGIPKGFTAHGYAILLLHVAAEIEHSLLVQYLYAGYSLGGPVATEHQAQVARWRETILGIAKEEMGHLMTIQNLLRVMGGPLNLDRQDMPWDSPFYPFPFALEPLSSQSLAKYVYIEAPPAEVWTDAEADEIRAQVEAAVGRPRLHRVGALYDLLQKLIGDPEAIKDADFDGSTFPTQVDWDEWGRGYQAGSRGDTTGQMPDSPDVLLARVTSRTDALNALSAIAEQGEANPTASDQQPSHFARFLGIYRQFPKDGEWSPARDVAVNPTTVEAADPATSAEITDARTRKWAELANLRYQLLLMNLAHTFQYPNDMVQNSQFTPRGLLVNSTFGEMYNIRALSGILMRSRVSHDGKQSAGPPFQMPFTTVLPADPADAWLSHADALIAAADLAHALSLGSDAAQATFLQTMTAVDKQTLKAINGLSRKCARHRIGLV